MKKIYYILVSFFLMSSLTSCKKDEPLLFSEFIENFANSALEIYNRSDKEVELDDYTIEIYLPRVKTIELKGTLKAKETFVIAQNMDSLSTDLKEKADFFTDNYMLTGQHCIALLRRGKVVDILGEKNSNYAFCTGKSMVRKTNYMRPTTAFDEYEWIRYDKNNLDHLNSVVNEITEKELLEGPRLTLEDLQRPFFNLENNSVGGGGVVDVTVASYGDGDTTQFNFPSELGIANGTKVRYQNVDTFESMVNNTQEWGVPAKNYTNEQLKNATKIQVQSVYEGEIYETYGRILGWVWVDGELLNFKIVKEGYSEVQFGESKATYKGILYTEFLYQAELYAKRNKLKMHGEKDPTWDYEKDQPKENY